MPAIYNSAFCTPYTEQTSSLFTTPIGCITQTHVVCPKHGTHAHTIESGIPGHEGTWCFLCALDLLGPPLPTEQRPWGE